MSESLNRELLLQFRDLVYSQYGIHYGREKTDILEMKLKKLAFARNYSLKEYYSRLIAGDRQALDELLHEITVGHTFFFREEAHLILLVEDIRKKRVVMPIVWCAASSTGEEPYSIVIFLLEHGITDFLIISSDVNATALEATNKGRYHVNQFQSTAKELLHKYFTKVDAYTWQIKPGLRKYLRIKRLNLHDNLEFEQNVDYIFCRNVMIYFDEEGRRKVLENLDKNLKPGGLLFVGHAEAMLTLPADLRKEAPAVFRKTS